MLKLNIQMLSSMIALLFLVSVNVVVAKDPCQSAYKALAENDDIIHVTEYDFRVPLTSISNTVYTSKDCQSFQKAFTVSDPDLLKCTNGHYVGVLPSSEIQPNLKCLKIVTCVGKMCKTNMIYLKYNKSVKKYTAIPRSSYLIFS
ncbi:hypothetical protein L3V83_11255 [Thiotrichales bacterium 19X7-9]|nr:hypothetical protein [Thiotrichales bacterium 19X7-9]